MASAMSTDQPVLTVRSLAYKSSSAYTKWPRHPLVHILLECKHPTRGNDTLRIPADFWLVLLLASVACATCQISWHHENPVKSLHAAAEGPRNEGIHDTVMTLTHTTLIHRRLTGQDAVIGLEVYSQVSSMQLGAFCSQMQLAQLHKAWTACILV